MPHTPQIITTGDGSSSLRDPLTGDTYHSTTGALAESRHIFIENGLGEWFGRNREAARVRILEAGFGSGLNALLTLREAEKIGVKIEYTAIELYPVPTETAAALSYAADPVFISLHESPWDCAEWITPGFSLTKLHGDLAVTRFEAIFDLVYFDAFAPGTQPQLWTAEIFARIFEALAPGGTLVTYSAKGDVKRALRAVGFTVSRLPGAPGKRHMLRAVKE